MVRGLFVVLALAAAAAQAQDVSKAAKGANAAQQNGPRVVPAASRPVPDTRAPSPTRSAGSRVAKGDAGAVRPDKQILIGCPVAANYLAGGGAPKGRDYPVPPSDQELDQEDFWDQPPYVKSVTHCGNRYIFQIWSESKERWPIDRATLEGPKGQLLHVVAIQFGKLSDGIDINVIVAEASPGTKLARLTLNLTGQDGRVARPEARDLP